MSKNKTLAGLNTLIKGMLNISVQMEKDFVYSAHEGIACIFDVNNGCKTLPLTNFDYIYWNGRWDSHVNDMLKHANKYLHTYVDNEEVGSFLPLFDKGLLSKILKLHSIIYNINQDTLHLEGHNIAIEIKGNRLSVFELIGGEVVISDMLYWDNNDLETIQDAKRDIDNVIQQLKEHDRG